MFCLQLSCRVDSYFLTSPGRKGPPIASNGYWMGIKVCIIFVVTVNDIVGKKIMNHQVIVCNVTQCTSGLSEMGRNVRQCISRPPKIGRNVRQCTCTSGPSKMS